MGAVFRKLKMKRHAPRHCPVLPSGDHYRSQVLTGLMPTFYACPSFRVSEVILVSRFARRSRRRRSGRPRRRWQRRWSGQCGFEIPSLGPNRSREAECGEIHRTTGVWRDQRRPPCHRARVSGYADLGRCFSTDGRRWRQAANSEPDKVHQIPSGQVTPGDASCFAGSDPKACVLPLARGFRA